MVLKGFFLFVCLLFYTLIHKKHFTFWKYEQQLVCDPLVMSSDGHSGRKKREKTINNKKILLIMKDGEEGSL